MLSNVFEVLVKWLKWLKWEVFINIQFNVLKIKILAVIKNIFYLIYLKSVMEIPISKTIYIFYNLNYLTFQLLLQKVIVHININIFHMNVSVCYLISTQCWKSYTRVRQDIKIENFS